MIVVKIELWSARTGKVTPLGRMIIANDGFGTGARRNYDVMVGKKTDAVNARTEAIIKKPLRRGKVKDYPAPSYNIWRLVSRALRAAFPEEK